MHFKCLYSTVTEFTQHKHDKYSLQTKRQKPADREIIGSDDTKLQAARGKFVAPVIVLRFLLVKYWCQLTPHMRFIGQWPLKDDIKSLMTHVHMI